MATRTQLWAWIEPAVQELHAYHAEHSDASWPDLRSHFLEQLGITEAAQYPAVDTLIKDLDERSDSERTELLADSNKLTELADRYTTLHADPDPAAAPQPGTPQQQDTFDQNAWFAFLAEVGPNWNGTDEHWAQFEPWLLAESNSRGFGPQTEALFAQVRGHGAAAVIELFRQYGVQIKAPAQAQPDQSQPSSQDLQVAETAMAELLAENPEFADIPEERRRELIAQLLAERAR